MGRQMPFHHSILCSEWPFTSKSSVHLPELIIRYIVRGSQLYPMQCSALKPVHAHLGQDAT